MFQAPLSWKWKCWMCLTVSRVSPQRWWVLKWTLRLKAGSSVWCLLSLYSFSSCSSSASSRETKAGNIQVRTFSQLDIRFHLNVRDEVSWWVTFVPLVFFSEGERRRSRGPWDSAHEGRRFNVWRVQVRKHWPPTPESSEAMNPKTPNLRLWDGRYSGIHHTGRSRSAGIATELCASTHALIRF